MALVVFTGGARSGKSRAAETLALARSVDGVPVTVAVFGRGSEDEEWAARIEHHRSARPAHFSVLEVSDPVGWIADVPAAGLLVVDCAGTLLGLCMERCYADRLADAPADGLPEGFSDGVQAMMDGVILEMIGRAGDTIVVTNEVGDGLVPDYASGRLFRDLLGRANRVLVDAADAAYLCVAGRLIDLVDLPREARWPDDETRNA